MNNNITKLRMIQNNIREDLHEDSKIILRTIKTTNETVSISHNILNELDIQTEQLNNIDNKLNNTYESYKKTIYYYRKMLCCNCLPFFNCCMNRKMKKYNKKIYKNNIIEENTAEKSCRINGQSNKHKENNTHNDIITTYVNSTNNAQMIRDNNIIVEGLNDLHNLVAELKCSAIEISENLENTNVKIDRVKDKSISIGNYVHNGTTDIYKLIQ